MNIHVKVVTESPIHLGSGKADVVLDAEVVHDDLGLPYLPAKRFKGVLYESALEVWEMSVLSGADYFSREALDNLFGKVAGGKAQLIIHDLHLADYDKLREGWQYLQSAYKEVVTPQDVLAVYTDVRYQIGINPSESFTSSSVYTDVRYQTSIDPKTGTHNDASLHNMRVVNAGISFEGELELVQATKEQKAILALALKNLRSIGAKRNRGFGRIHCEVQDQKLKRLADKVLAGGTNVNVSKTTYHH